MKIRNLLHNPLLQKTSAALLSALGILLLILGTHKEITLFVNGEPRQVTTYSLTVNGVLKGEGFLLSEQDRVFPSPTTWLWGGETLYLRLSNLIEISVDGRTVNLETVEDRPENVLLEAGFSLFPKDRILVDGELFTNGERLEAGKDHVIRVLRGTQITLVTESGEITFITDGESLEEALEKEEIEIYPADQLSRPLETPLTGSPIAVELIRAKPYQVQLADQTVTIRTTADTVGAALAQTGIALQGLDYSIPAETQPLPEGGQIKIIRIREEVLLNQEKIQFSNEYQPDDSLELDQVLSLIHI